MKIRFLLFFLIVAARVFPEVDFDSLMGKGTKAWDYVETKEDFERLRFYRKHFYENVSEKCRNSIPKVGHIVWLGPHPLPKRSIAHIQKWIQLHPDWKFRLWTDHLTQKPNIEGLDILSIDLISFRYLSACYDRCDNLKEKALILGYEILLKEGGLYFEHDVEALKSLNKLHQAYDFYTGLQELKPAWLSTSIYSQEYLIASSQEHPVLISAMKWLANNWDYLEEAFSGKTPKAISNKMLHRGIWALSHGIDEAFNLPGQKDIIFPAAYFSSIYTKHHHASTWKQDIEPQLDSHRQNMKHLVKENEEVVLLLLSLLFFGSISFVISFSLIKKQKKHASVNS